MSPALNGILPDCDAARLAGVTATIEKAQSEATAVTTAAYGKACELMCDWGQPDAVKDAIAT
jgi:hypothetical protein